MMPFGNCEQRRRPLVDPALAEMRHAGDLDRIEERPAAAAPAISRAIDTG